MILSVNLWCWWWVWWRRRRRRRRWWWLYISSWTQLVGPPGGSNQYIPDKVWPPGYIGWTLVVDSCPGFILSKIEFLKFLACEAVGRAWLFFIWPDYCPPAASISLNLSLYQHFIRSFWKETTICDVRPWFDVNVQYCDQALSHGGAFLNSWAVRLMVVGLQRRGYLVTCGGAAAAWCRGRQC